MCQSIADELNTSVFDWLSMKYMSHAIGISQYPEELCEEFPLEYQQQHRILSIKSDDDRKIDKKVLTIQLQKWIINLTFMLLNPDEQFALNISCRPFRVFLVQCSCLIYQVINPILCVSIFDTSLSLLVLHMLSDTQTDQLDLVLDIQDDFFSRTSIARLDISV